MKDASASVVFGPDGFPEEYVVAREKKLIIVILKLHYLAFI